MGSFEHSIQDRKIKLLTDVQALVATFCFSLLSVLLSSPLLFCRHAFLLAMLCPDHQRHTRATFHQGPYIGNDRWTPGSVTASCSFLSRDEFKQEAFRGWDGIYLLEMFPAAFEFHRDNRTVPIFPRFTKANEAILAVFGR